MYCMSVRSTALIFARELLLTFYRQAVASYYRPYKKEYLNNQVLGCDDLMHCDMINQYPCYFV